MVEPSLLMAKNPDYMERVNGWTKQLIRLINLMEDVG